jgi:hypothetical protein
MYSVFTKLADGDFLLVASFDELKQAARLVADFNESFPHEYLVRDSKGNNISLNE